MNVASDILSQSPATQNGQQAVASECAAVPAPAAKACHHFRKPHGCREGAACRFSHATPATLAHSRDPTEVCERQVAGSEPVTSDAATTPGDTDMSDRLFAAVLSSSSSNAAAVCHFFQSPQGCRNGAACRYSHQMRAVETAISPASGSDAEAVRGGGGSSNSSSSSNNDIVSAASSSDAHSSSDVGSRQGTTPCAFFQTAGGCRFGAKCRNSHDASHAARVGDALGTGSSTRGSVQLPRTLSLGAERVEVRDTLLSTSEVDQLLAHLAEHVRFSLFSRLYRSLTIRSRSGTTFDSQSS